MMDFQSAYDEWKELIAQEREIKTRKRELREIMSKLPRPNHLKTSGTRVQNKERDKEMAELYKAGKNLREIGDMYGITRERVRQILVRLGVDPRKPMNNLPCKVDGCKNLANGSKGYCSTHYQRWLLKGDVSDPVFKKRTLVCAVEGCGRPYKSSGLCDKHSVNFTINKNKGLIADMEDFLNVQKAKRLMGKTYARFSEIRKFMESNKHLFNSESEVRTCRETHSDNTSGR